MPSTGWLSGMPMAARIVGMTSGVRNGSPVVAAEREARRPEDHRARAAPTPGHHRGRRTRRSWSCRAAARSTSGPSAAAIVSTISWPCVLPPVLLRLGHLVGAVEREAVTASLVRRGHAGHAEHLRRLAPSWPRSMVEQPGLDRRWTGRRTAGCRRALSGAMSPATGWSRSTCRARRRRSPRPTRRSGA